MHYDRMKVGGVNLGARGLWSLVLQVMSFGFVAWTAVRVSDLFAELAALNPGQEIETPSWDWFIGCGLSTAIGVGLFLRRRFGLASALALSTAAFAEFIWIGFTR